MVTFESFGAVSYSTFVVTLALSWHHLGDKTIGRKSQLFHTPCIPRRPRHSRRNIAMTFAVEKLEW